MSAARATAAATLFAAAVAACDGPSLSQDSGVDAGVDVPTCVSTTPTFASTVRQPMPYRVATIRGHAAGARIVLIDGLDSAGPVRATVDQDDAFCLDFVVPNPVPNHGVFELKVQSQNADGFLSCMKGSTTLRIDPSAPPVMGAMTCNSVDPAECTTDEERGDLCANGRDDDCDGLRDGDEPACNPCQDDPLEPNDSVDAPRVMPNVLLGSLMRCPNNDDYYALTVHDGYSVAAQLDYPLTGDDLQLELLNERGQLVMRGSLRVGTDKRSRTVAGTYHAPDAGVAADGGVSNPAFKIRVTGATPGATNTYTLSVNTQPAS